MTSIDLRLRFATRGRAQIFAGILACLSVPVGAEESLEQKAERGDQEAAERLCISRIRDQMRYCEIAALAGDEQSVYALWRNYEYGKRTPMDRERALHWLRLAVERDYPWGWVELGKRYLYGLNVKQNDAEAYRCFAKVKKTKDYYFGYLIETGRGTERDYAKAAKWYAEANQRPDPYWQTEFRLGLLALQGLGLPADENYAEHFLARARNHLMENSSFIGLGAQRSMGIIEADVRRPDRKTEREQVENLRRKAEQGDAEAEYRLATAYMAGLGVPLDKKTANEWYARAALHGHLEAQYAFGLAQYIGKFLSGEERLPKEALYWLRLVHAAGDRRATYVVGWMTLRGIGTQRDVSEGIRLITLAADAGLTEAQAMLAVTYALGRDAGRDLDRSKMWWARYEKRTMELYLKGMPPYVRAAAEE